MSREEFEKFSDNITNKPFSLEPYKEFIVQRLSQFPGTPAAQMHDWLKEHYPDFPHLSPKTVYNYVMKLRSDYSIPKTTAKERQYKALPLTPPGMYAQVDFGHKKLRSSDGKMHTVHFMVTERSQLRKKYLIPQQSTRKILTEFWAHRNKVAHFKLVYSSMIRTSRIDTIILMDPIAPDNILGTIGRDSIPCNH